MDTEPWRSTRKEDDTVGQHDGSGLVIPMAKMLIFSRLQGKGEF